MGNAVPLHLSESELVHALLQLAVLRADAKGKPGESGWPGSVSRETGQPFECYVARAFDVLMHECIRKHADIRLQDELTPVLRARGVRAVLRKHTNSLSSQFRRWASLDLGPLDSNESMTLHELLVSLKEANVLDSEKVTAKFVIKSFLIVNAVSGRARIIPTG